MEQSISQQKIILILNTLVSEEVIKVDTRNRIIEELENLAGFTSNLYRGTFLKLIERLEYKKGQAFSASSQYHSTDTYQETIEDGIKVYDITVIRHNK